MSDGKPGYGYLPIKSQSFQSTPVADKTPGKMEGDELEKAIKLFEGAALSFSESYIKDPSARIEYNKRAKEASNEIINAVKNRKITPHEGAIRAHSLRDTVMMETRHITSSIGVKYAESSKKETPPLRDYEEKYAQKNFSKSFTELTQAEKENVWTTIVERSGEARPRANRTAKIVGLAGRTVAVMTIFVGTYYVIHADNKVRQANKEVVTAGTGALGGYLVGVLLAATPAGWAVTALSVLLAGAISVAASTTAFDMFWPEDR